MRKTMVMEGYALEVLSPIFYSSFEGNVISTDGVISSTALTYALADALRLRNKDYFLYGKEAITPKYEELEEIPIFATDGIPIELRHTPIEFKSVMFWAEENIQIGSQQNPYPEIMNTASKSPFFKQVRQYVGIDVGSRFQCIIVSKEKLDDEFLINLGIRRSGEVKLKKIAKLPEYINLNYFMLDKVYGVPKEKLLLTGAKIKTSGIKRSGDFRLVFLQNVPLEYFKNEILPWVVKKWK
ncbi:MAG: hypothetical protein H5T45_03600 [Thermoplasmatales archaeon]|nr:hypothetical protein [Thermoplasmatales archaeon]